MSRPDLAPMPLAAPPAGAPGRGRFRGWVVGHPLGGFLALTFALSWSAFAVAALGGGAPFVILGAFGPATAAALVTRWSGGSVSAWFRGLWVWRVPARYYLYALGLPPLLMATVAAEMALLGHAVDLGAPGGVALGYLATLLVVALLGGGQEEPGWRGYAQRRFQARWSPFRTTLLLGAVWGAWHLPVYGLGGFAGPLLLVWFYSWLYNRTGSVLLCVLLHAGFNTAVGYLDLAEHGLAAVGPLAVTCLVAAAVLVRTTGGLMPEDPPRRG